MINKDYLLSELKESYFNGAFIDITKKFDIYLYAHKDRVGFNVIKENDNRIYVIYKYGNINESAIKDISRLFSLKFGLLEIKIIKIYKDYIFIQSDKRLEIGDFLLFEPNYFIKDDMIFGPYLDNLIGNIVIRKILLNNRNIGVQQSIDEEDKLLYSIFPKSKISFVLDVLWQDYLDEKINLDKIYNVIGTKYKKLDSLVMENVKNVQLKLPFKLEPDFIENGEVIYLLCPIIGGHLPVSSVKIDTLFSYIEIVGLLINNKLGKKS
ncbi:MAG: hypothetical protein PHS92_05105 [Candidatus Gracilibacteria bacterium]|nr:hypothetical protein [Candidatus Gracilibacteria bacterium]